MNIHTPIAFYINQPINWKRALMQLEGAQLDAAIKQLTREQMIEWLQWNDPNGIYADDQSLKEIGTVLTLEEGATLIKMQIQS